MANTNVSSVGLMGLSHFRTSRISREMYEPVWLNLYTVDIQLPKKLSIGDDDKNLLLEGVKKVDGLDTSKLPGTSTQTYKYATRSFSGSGPEQTFIELKLDFEVNVRGCGDGKPNMFTVQMLRKWSDLAYDPLTGRAGLKVDYVAPTMTITLHDKKYQPFWQWICYNVFPTTNITMPNLDYGKKTDVYSVNGYTLRCDYWDETIL